VKENLLRFSAVFCVIAFRKLVCDPKVKLKYQHLITNSFVEVGAACLAVLYFIYL